MADLDANGSVPRFSVVMTAFATLCHLPRAVSCVLQQSVPSWELLIVLDGPPADPAYAPDRLLRGVKRQFPEIRQRMAWWELPRSEGTWGNTARRFGLAQARGEYVCWVNHDNLVAQEYLAAHAENIARRPGCVSVVAIDLWKNGRCFGRYPRALARSRIDLLCLSVPRATALEVDAFGPAMEREYAADWLVFEACARRLPVEPSSRVVGTHF